MEFIDLRSDTVTEPTPEMREAMKNAVVGDDVDREDPTVNALEEKAAEMLGKDAGLFVTSGTQGNLISVLTWCGRGEEVILGDKSHTYMLEQGGISALGSVHPRPVTVLGDGSLDLNEVKSAIRGDRVQFPRTKLIALENTQGSIGGIPVSVEHMDAIGEIAKAHDLHVHIDGARIFNAATALNVPVDRLVQSADSITFCLSKGLCAPVGSLIVGSQEFIDRARRMRHLLGGGMRQAGVIAAAGLVALESMVDRLSEDHANARRLGEGLVNNPYLELDLDRVKTSFVYFDLKDDSPLTGEELKTKLKEKYGIIMRPYPGRPRTFRLVTHYWITPERVDCVIDAVNELLS